LPWLNYDAFQKMFNLTKNVLKDHEIDCICGRRLNYKNLIYSTSMPYDTLGQVPDDVAPHEKEYWIYCHCKYCNYDYNYEKIGRQFWDKVVVHRFQEANK